MRKRSKEDQQDLERTRARILAALGERELTCIQLAQSLDLSASVIANHLNEFVRKGVVEKCRWICQPKAARAPVWRKVKSDAKPVEPEIAAPKHVIATYRKDLNGVLLGEPSYERSALYARRQAEAGK